MNQSIKHVLLLACLSLFMSNAQKIVHVPLDERFATRVAFLNLAKLTPFQVSSLPETYLPSLKKWSPPDQIVDWMLAQSKTANGVIISLETVLYGSLISSRVSNYTVIDIKQRVQKLLEMKIKNPAMKIYVSGVVMRIPEYDGDFQQPWFWKDYGKLLYSYSYYEDKYNKLHNQADQKISEQAKKQIPVGVLQEFLWRRNRNQQILLYLLQVLSNNDKIFEKIYITLDDNAEYGFNVAEADQIRTYIRDKNLTKKVLVYPGADQVSLSLLAKYSVDFLHLSPPTLNLIFRNSSTSKSIPNYEGIPMLDTIQYQIEAAGGSFLNSSSSSIQLLINNFDEIKQIQAPDQFDKAKDVNYQIFTPFICQQTKNVVGFIDNRFSNGGDSKFMEYLLAETEYCGRIMDRWAYAGWNTNGNTVGTVISNSIILSLFGQKTKQINKRVQQKYCSVCSPCPYMDVYCANSYFNAIRIIQDLEWQSIMRANTRNYISWVHDDDPNDLSKDLDFYEKFALKPMQSYFKQQLQARFELDFKIDGVYFPWNRTFEIGIYGEMKQRPRNQSVYE